MPTWAGRKQKTANIGLDVELLNGIITGTIDVYQAKTSDILYLRNLPTSTGVVNNYQNIAATKNQGIEISITSRNITTDKFKWTTTATFTSNKEQITKLINGKDIISSNDDGSLLLGRPIKSFYTYEKTGHLANQRSRCGKYLPSCQRQYRRICTW